jgi:hypothetical protein
MYQESGLQLRCNHLPLSPSDTVYLHDRGWGLLVGEPRHGPLYLPSAAVLHQLITLFMMAQVTVIRAEVVYVQRKISFCSSYCDLFTKISGFSKFCT